MPNESHLDSRYFVDTRVYNCPFCNRRHVAYEVLGQHQFDWTDKKGCTAYFVRCDSCEKQSMHLTFNPIELQYIGNSGSTRRYRFQLKATTDEGEILDGQFFFSVPTSYFVLDERVPRILRELLTEAEGCLKSNYLTGASACARKIVYELGILHRATGSNYEDRIKSLKSLHPEVDTTFFDTLLTIQQVTSTKVHENSYDGWEAKHLRLILLSLSDVLHELYVVPALRADRRAAVLELKDKLIPKTPASPSNEF